MTYLCMACGNHESFRATQEVTEYVVEEISDMDGEGEIDSYGDSETNDSEVTEGPNNIECNECDGDDVQDLDGDAFRDALATIRPNDEAVTAAPPEPIAITNWSSEIGDTNV